MLVKTIKTLPQPAVSTIFQVFTLVPEPDVGLAYSVMRDNAVNNSVVNKLRGRRV